MRRGGLALVALAAGLSACGHSSPAPIPAAARIVRAPGAEAGAIVLTAAGAQRIGVRTAPVRTAADGSTAIVPLSAVVYAPSGTAYAFVKTAPLTYSEVTVTIDHISGASVWVRRGPRAGETVVTVGAEELYGVQTGVLAQT